MDVKEAVRAAKAYVSDLFAEEKLRHVSLEEIEFDEAQRLWLITIGFSRPWEFPSPVVSQLFPESSPAPNRTYKVVSLDDSGKVKSVRNRIN